MRFHAAVVSVLIAGGCAAPRVNPSFSVTTAEAKQDLRRMREAAAAPSRPVVIVGGYSDPGFVAFDLTSRLRRVLGKEAVIVSADVGFTFSMDGARDRLLSRVEEALGASREGAEQSVDVVAVSMGGLVARYAAMAREDGRRLRIAHLYTISSPHGGANLARVPTLESRVRDMRKGSEFLANLDRQSCDYELVPYARLNDMIVGAENAAPAGLAPWWVDTPAFEASHLQAHSDARILADIARRLRGEKPYTQGAATPVPAGI